MKLNTIIIFMLIFSLTIVAGVTLYNDTASEYGITTSTIGNNYNYVNDLSATTNGSYQSIKGSQSSSGTDSNFLVDIGTMWGVVKSLFNSAEFTQEVTGQASQDLGIPSIIPGVFISLITIALITLLVSIAVRWKVD